MKTTRAIVATIAVSLGIGAFLFITDEFGAPAHIATGTGTVYGAFIFASLASIVASLGYVDISAYAYERAERRGDVPAYGTVPYLGGEWHVVYYRNDKKTGAVHGYGTFPASKYPGLPVIRFDLLMAEDMATHEMPLTNPQGPDFPGWDKYKHFRKLTNGNGPEECAMRHWGYDPGEYLSLEEYLNAAIQCGITVDNYNTNE